MADSSPAIFTVTEHVIDAGYIREYPNATVSQDSPLKLVVKRYTPIDNSDPQPGDVTIIGAHGCGLPKELYEPLWEEILGQSKQQGFRIGSIWIADMVNLGASGVVNEELLGDDPSWFDHPRDLLYMINQFRHEMPRPIIGVGHSMGATQLALLSLIHPRLFTSLVLIEPALTRKISNIQHFALLSIKRRDTWASKSEAIKSATRSFAQWDSRVLKRWNEHGYRSSQTTIYPQTGGETKHTDGPVTSTSSKYQEAMLYIRPNFMGHTTSALADPTKAPMHDPLVYPDIIDPPHPSNPFYRSESHIALSMLNHIRPPVFYLFSEKNSVSTSEERGQILGRTGAGIGGSGGVKHSQVKTTIVLDCGHMVPLEKVTETASLIGTWIGQSVQGWNNDELRVQRKWTDQSTREVLTAPAKWRPKLEKGIKSEAQKKRPKI
ncbi:hypothetical protein N7517_009526 [Penicillium concentricum]|uniref:AB hydrolase-1 domain-containing protein n=1 Tax=Penicillium concentricum TaxID=293559 RepID=A0A9W9RHK0_9EURO|nr:uncharacterized protein N7517_009526 [Penicillium concentricum]KAJ5360335.1 hypothetical protein N7517_009526 [Penicillium concentricum]